MTRNHNLGRRLELAAIAFATGFTTHGHTSSSLGVLAGTFAVCALVARSTLRRRGPAAALA
ncbi:MULTISPECIES: hypothetical protein [Cupriavidus]|uniref:Uncharacterized protein n=1 Tax=Cupriavidus pauculus TaxID=82633 RepID=A0A5P2HG86_9BURK|nr:hypothetical protein [Cupriavidus pauculus]QET06159.1 hypothetical protein FOB72_30045 [Cupriavidus pauculus]